MASLDCNVLLLSDDYLPDSTRNHAKMMHELAVKFVSNKHRTYVLTPSNKSQKRRLEAETIDGVTVLRFKAPDFRSRGKIWRAINEALLPIRALYALWSSKEYKSLSFDICVNYSPTIFFAPVAMYFRKQGSFVYLILRDFFPHWAIDSGILKYQSVITYFFRWIEGLNYRASNVIAVQSPANIPVFQKIYVNPANVRVLMNWSEHKRLSKKNFKNCGGIRSRLGIGKDKVVFFYGGNIGQAQDMINIVQLAVELLDDNRAHFLLVGQGDEYKLVEEAVSTYKLTNLTLLPSVSQEEYRNYVAHADIGLISLAKSHTSHNFPGKLLGYMVEHLPILGSVNSGNDILDIINSAEAGFVSVNGETEVFLRDARLMLDNPKARRVMGNNSNQLLRSSFSVKTAYDAIWSSYSSLGGL